MLVRLAPGAHYPPHTHADNEELYLLDGELWIDGRKLRPGDYNYGAPGERDERVWSETGCTCVSSRAPRTLWAEASDANEIRDEVPLPLDLFRDLRRCLSLQKLQSKSH